MAFSVNSSSTSSSSSLCSYSSSHSLYFLLLQHKPHSSYAPKPLARVAVSSCRRLAELETDKDQPQQRLQQPRRVKLSLDVGEKKTVRKLRPSFLDQIQEKWSAKVGSRREKFPWQEQRELEEVTEPVTESVTKPVTEPVTKPVTEPDSETELRTRVEAKVSTLSQSVSFGLRTVVGSPPWVHGSGPTKPSKTLAETGNKNKNNNDDVYKPSNEFSRRVDSKANGVHEEETRETTISETNSSLLESETIFKKKKVVSFSSSGPTKLRRSNENQEETSMSKKDSSFGIETVKEKTLSRSADDVAEGEKFERRRSNTVEAETTLPEHELKRLRNASLRMVGRIKVGARGITQALVDAIHEKWELDEVVKLKFEKPLSLNMRRVHEIMEDKTGGLVIWRSGSSLVLYRGMTYNLRCVQSYTKQILTDREEVTTGVVHVNDSVRTPFPTRDVKAQSGREMNQQDDFDNLSDELGPRFVDWQGRPPLPVDADLLPGVVPGYKRPFRLVPHGVRQAVGNQQMTRLRRKARLMAPHFALGRNRELQGLAEAMLRLWEKSEIAKIAIKRGVENTRNERMAEELKVLTGGVLVSRNKEYIVFYRGNDLLPPAVMGALKERGKLRDLRQDEEELARQSAPDFIESKSKALTEQLVAGTLAETEAAIARWGKPQSPADVQDIIKEASLIRRQAVIRDLEWRLNNAKASLGQANKALEKIQEDLNLSDPPDDLETITDEERALFRKMGLSMRPFLLLGKRGFYGGTVENIHLHWKHRELVKVIMKARYLDHVKSVAIHLEAESGGVLVSVDKTPKGFAIIIYRGKNYLRPIKIKPRNLLTKRQALARSREVQRREALRRHVSDLKERIELLKSELGESRNGTMIDDGRSLRSSIEDSFVTGDLSEDDNDDDDDDDNDDDDGDALYDIYENDHGESSDRELEDLI